MNDIKEVAKIYSELQLNVCKILEEADGKALFEGTRWNKEIGSGLTNVIRNGTAIEKGGVNYSFVEGAFSPLMEKLLNEKANRYAVTGISSIMHPVNPFVPIIHMNVRHFALDNGIQWFGGGIDLTPHYIDVEEARTFHLELKTICDKYNRFFYPQFKKWADEYFFLPHRNETRGIGGIFFDRLKPDETNHYNQLLDFTIDLCNAYPRIYSRLIRKNTNRKYSAAQKKWQQIRRGRYVEFNLIYDRGTKFGLESNGNTESILISLPETASWEYNFVPGLDSPEYHTQQLLKKNMDWLHR